MSTRGAAQPSRAKRYCPITWYSICTISGCHVRASVRSRAPYAATEEPAAHKGLPRSNELRRDHPSAREKPGSGRMTSSTSSHRSCKVVSRGGSDGARRYSRATRCRVASFTNSCAVARPPPCRASSRGGNGSRKSSRFGRNPGRVNCPSTRSNCAGAAVERSRKTALSRRTFPSDARWPHGVTSTHENTARPPHPGFRRRI